MRVGEAEQMKRSFSLMFDTVGLVGEELVGVLLAVLLNAVVDCYLVGLMMKSLDFSMHHRPHYLIDRNRC